MQKLHRKPKKKSLLMIGAFFLALLIPLIVFFSPEQLIFRGLFFICLFTGLFYIVEFLVSIPRRSLLVAGGTTLYVLLRSLDLHHWLYPLLIVAIVFAIEMYYRNR